MVVEIESDMQSRSVSIINEEWRFYLDLYITQREVDFCVLLSQTKFRLKLQVSDRYEWPEIEYCLVSNQSEKYDYKQNLAWINKIQKRFLCV